jgi:hypothetical protein
VREGTSAAGGATGGGGAGGAAAKGAGAGAAAAFGRTVSTALRAVPRGQPSQVVATSRTR